ncbi:hypothetical protein FQR65_LT20489 [Abscondita terminalis]|nr:hypothetical protein FQR65_LT20489 [Abscondita terminalis]
MEEALSRAGQGSAASCVQKIAEILQRLVSEDIRGATARRAGSADRVGPKERTRLGALSRPGPAQQGAAGEHQATGFLGPRGGISAAARCRTGAAHSMDIRALAQMIEQISYELRASYQELTRRSMCNALARSTCEPDVLDCRVRVRVHPTPAPGRRKPDRAATGLPTSLLADRGIAARAARIRRRGLEWTLTPKDGKSRPRNGGLAWRARPAAAGMADPGRADAPGIEPPRKNDARQEDEAGEKASAVRRGRRYADAQSSRRAPPAIAQARRRPAARGARKSREALYVYAGMRSCAALRVRHCLISSSPKPPRWPPRIHAAGHRGIAARHQAVAGQQA